MDIIFSKEDKGDKRYGYSSYGNRGSDSSKYCFSGGEWAFVNNKKSLQIRIEYTNPDNRIIIGPFGTVNVTWEIRRLKEKELWLKNTYTDGREYFIKFQLKAS